MLLGVIGNEPGNTCGLPFGIMLVIIGLANFHLLLVFRLSSKQCNLVLFSNAPDGLSKGQLPMSLTKLKGRWLKCVCPVTSCLMKISILTSGVGTSKRAKFAVLLATAALFGLDVSSAGSHMLLEVLIMAILSSVFFGNRMLPGLKRRGPDPAHGPLLSSLGRAGQKSVSRQAPTQVG
jgi:hypothetical protein